MRKNIFFAILSAGLLIFSFPNFNLFFLIWVALVPLFFLLDGKSPKAAFLWGWFTGYLFFLGTHYWLIHVTLPGMLLVNLYLGIYFGLFGLGYAFFQGFPFKHKFWVLPCLWVACEFGRDRLFTGFGWACLGHSQYQVLPLIQIADVTGVFGVSFLVAMVNVLVKDIIEKSKNSFPTANGNLRHEGMGHRVSVPILGVVIVAVLGYGAWKLPQYISKPEKNLWVAIIQPNIPQSRKWDPESWEGIQKKILAMTEKALKQKPDLMIWPETSFPGYPWQSPDRYEEIKTFVVHNHVPLLFGTVTQRDGEYYNSAILLSGQGQEVARYDKMHLVPFGEFLPLRPFLNFIENFVPIGDFGRGKEWTVFPASLVTEDPALPRTPRSGPRLNFSVLICFEDTVAPMMRSLKNKDAQFLVNITNDGWFQDTNAPFLHLQASVFQAVANRRAILRSANTGVSGDISPCGIAHIFRDPSGKAVMVEGFMMNIIQSNREVSFYTRFGDVFAYLCLFVVWLGLIKKKYSL